MKIEISIGTENEEEWDHWCYCDTIVEAIVYFLNNKEKAIEFGKNGRRWVEDSFDQKKFKEEYIKNRKSLLGII